MGGREGEKQQIYTEEDDNGDKTRQFPGAMLLVKYSQVILDRVERTQH